MDYSKEVIAAFRRDETKDDSSLESSGTQDVKQTLLRYIGENPGIWYRELLRLTGLSNGTLAHHLRGLEENSRIRVQRESNFGKTRYFALDVTESESNIIGFLRSDTTKQIVLLMFERDYCTFSELVEGTAKSASTISWHLKRMVAGGIVKIRESDHTLYSLADRERVSDVLSRYRRSFLETTANNYENIIDEI